MKMIEWLMETELNDLGVYDDDNNVILSDADIRFALSNYNSYDIRYDLVSSCDYLYTTFRNMYQYRVSEINNILTLSRNENILEDSETETTETTYGKTESSTDTKTTNNTRTDNLANTMSTTTTNTDSSTMTRTKSPMGGSADTFTDYKDTYSDTAGGTVTAGGSNTGTVGFTGTDSNTGSKNVGGKDTVERTKQWTNNNLYDMLIDTRMKLEADFSLLDWYIARYVDTALYIKNDVWEDW